jgi:hypothetical protein
LILSPVTLQGGESIQATIRADLEKTPFLEARGTAHVEVEAELGEALEAKVRCADLKYGDLDLDILEAHAEWREQRGRIILVRAEGRSGRIEAREIVVDPERPHWIASFRYLDLLLPDLRSLVPAVDRRVSLAARGSSADGRSVAIQRLSVETDGARMLLSGEARLAEDPADWKKTHLRLSCEGSVGDADRLLPILPDITGAITITGSVEGELGSPRGSFGATGTDLTLEGRRAHRLELSSGVDWPLLSVDVLHLEAESGVVDASAKVHLLEKTLDDGAFTLRIEDLAGFFAMFPGAPELEGSAEGSGTFSRDSTGLRGDLALNASQLVYDGERIGRVRLGAHAAGSTITLKEAAGSGEWGSATASGSVDIEARTGRVETLKAKGKDWALLLRSPTDLAWSGEGTFLRGLDLDALHGTVQGAASWTDHLAAKLRCEGMDLSPWGAEGILLLDAEVAGDGIRVREFHFDGGEALNARGSASLPWRIARGGIEQLEGGEKEIALVAHVRDVGRFVDLEAAAARVELKGGADGLRAEVGLEDFVPAEGLTFEGETKLVLDASPKGLFASLQTPPHSAAHVSGALRADRSVDWTRPEQIGEALDEARVSGSLDLEFADLGLLEGALPDVLHLAGRGEVKLEVDGPWRAPDLKGHAELADVSCTLKGDVPPLRRGRGRLSFDGRKLHIEGLEAELGYAPLSITGVVHLPDEESERTMDLLVKGQNVLLSRSQHIRLRTNLDLSISGPLHALLAKGKVEVTDALYSQPMDLFAGSAPAADHKLQLFAVREGPLSTMRFDIEIFGDRAFRISNNIVRGHFSPALRLRGTGAVPEPNGSVFFQDVLVKLELTSLKVDHGEVRFLPENPFAPEIRIAAHTRMQGFDLDVALEGAIPDVEVYVTCNPPLPPRDAIILLMTGSTPERLEQKGTQGALMLAGTIAGKRLLSKVQGPSDPDEESFLDRFSLEMGRDVSQSGEETIEAEFRIAKRWYARGERDRYDDYNFGVAWRLRFR